LACPDQPTGPNVQPSQAFQTCDDGCFTQNCGQPNSTQETACNNALDACDGQCFSGGSSGSSGSNGSSGSSGSSGSGGFGSFPFPFPFPGQ
jgi:hypothetical protein